MTRSEKNIILGVTGSIAAYRACDIASGLKKQGFSVTCIMTKEAKEFITSLSLQTLSGNKVYSDMFSSPSAKPEEWSPLHTSLADSADLILIVPATANIIGKIANGICDDLLSSIIISSKAKVVFAPAMNENMYAHKSVKKNIKTLENLGYKFIGPKKGRLACGCVGMGHIADTDEIIGETKRLLK